MKVFKLERSQILPISIERAWEYFSNPLNLADITPPDLSLKIKGNLNVSVRNGMLIEYTLKPLLRLEMDWVSEIKYVQEPYYFVDEQRVGPYKLWYHQHFFRELGTKQVEIIDIVHYALPFGPISSLLNKYIVKEKLSGIFSFRKQVLEQKFLQGEVMYEQEFKV